MNASPAVREAAQRLCTVLDRHWSRFAAYRPPQGFEPAQYCPYAAIALVTGGPVPDPGTPLPPGADRSQPWKLASMVEIIDHCRTDRVARELVARFYANARRSGMPSYFDMGRPASDLLGVWNAHQHSREPALEIAKKIANRLK